MNGMDEDGVSQIGNMPPVDPIAGQTVPAGATCLNCGYSLEGLELPGKCPECGTGLAESLRWSALGFLEKRDANLLSIGLQMIVGSIGLTLLGVLMMMIGVTPIGVPLAVAAALVWTFGWHAVALVRAPGFGENGPFVRRVAIGAAWVQTLGFLPLAGILLSAVGVTIVADEQLALLTTAASIGIMLGCGHWRLTSVSRRGGDGGLIQNGMIAGITMAIMLLFDGLAIIDLLSTGVGRDVVMLVIAFLSTVIAAGTWGSYVLSLIEAANARAGPDDKTKPASPGAPGSGDGS